MITDSQITGEVTELVQQLIRNKCVNDGTPESGQEHRNATVIQSYLEGSGLDIQTYEPAAGRTSLVARIEGTDPTAASLLLLGHTDVVPANPAEWTRDPFGGELVDGQVHGRGAIDMLNLTAAMAVSMRHLADEGFRPRGSLIYAAVADEEAGGKLGAKWLIDNERQAVQASGVITEFGGIPVDPIGTAKGVRLWITVGNKGTSWCQLRVKGTSGHGSMPYGSDNAVVKAALLVHRLSSAKIHPQVNEVWRAFVEGMAFEPDLHNALLDPNALDEAIAQLSTFSTGLAKRAHAATRMTVAPTVFHGGSKTNVIPDYVELNLDIRRLPGQTVEDVTAFLNDVIGDDLRADVEINMLSAGKPTISPIDTPLWNSLSRVSEQLVPGATCIPALTAGANDAGPFREIDSTAYGYGLFGPRMNVDRFMDMFHGPNECVDQESLRLSTELCIGIARDFLCQEISNDVSKARGPSKGGIGF